VSSLSKAREKAMGNGIKNAEFVIADAANMPFKDNEFDAVISLNFLHLFCPPKRQELFVRAMKRVVKGGAIIMLSSDVTEKDKTDVGGNAALAKILSQS